MANPVSKVIHMDAYIDGRPCNDKVLWQHYGPGLDIEVVGEARIPNFPSPVDRPGDDPRIRAWINEIEGWEDA